MAMSENLTTLGELADIQLEDEEDNETLQRIVVAVERNYPEGWRQWKVLDVPKEDLVGKKPDSNILNKLRYALPTVDLIKAFDEDAHNLSEKAFKDMKLSLLEWPFTKALIIYPVTLGIKIRGSAARYELFSAAVDDVKRRVVSREDANRILRGEHTETYERKRRSTSTETDIPSKSRRLDMTEKAISELAAKTQNIEQLLQQLISGQVNTGCSSESDDYEDVSSPIHRSDEEDESVMHAFLGSDEPVSSALSFLPDVKEIEPTIPQADPLLVKQGVSCQRLGTSGWNKVRFADAQKRLQANPVFTALKMNESIKNKESKWCNSDILTKFDHSLAVISHGLLKQRMAFAKGIEAILKEVDSPDLKEVIAKNLSSSDSEFRTVSDDLLQFTCGRRADIISNRRDLVKSSSKYMNNLLREIPPSTTHLFDDGKLLETIKNNGGHYKFFQRKVPLRYQTENKRRENTTRQRPSQGARSRFANSAPPSTSKQGKKHQTFGKAPQPGGVSKENKERRRL
nr:unnamed protein product [Callosobruchus analis]